MLSKEEILREIQNTLLETDFSRYFGNRQQGKVRDWYKRGNERIIIVTDRISAFDKILGTIPFKGQVLNQIAAFWFEKTRHIAPNHVIFVPDPNVMIVRECKQLPIEIVVRGYITGVTKTSLWYNYERGVRVYCGHKLPEGLRKDQKLDTPIVTPTTKLEEHDRPVSRDEIIKEGLVDADTFDRAAEICLKLYDFGVKFAETRGLILVDTKYELGIDSSGNLVVTDEIHTPDSSRYWYLDTYEDLFRQGKEQRKIDKEFVREWYVKQGYRGEGVPPKMSEDVIVEASLRYIEVFEKITGEHFVASFGNLISRIESNLRRYGYL